MQAMGLLFTARPELMWDVKGCLALLEEQLQPGARMSCQPGHQADGFVAAHGWPKSDA